MLRHRSFTSTSFQAPHLTAAWRYQPKVPGRPASYTDAICSSVTSFLLTIYGTATHSSAISPLLSQAPEESRRRERSPSCKADLRSPAFTMETSNTPNGSWGSKLHPLTPISGWSYSTETSAPLAEELRSIFLQFRPCQQRLQGGWSWTSCCLSSALQVRLLWIKMPSLYALSQILSSRKQESEPSDTTSATTADDQQEGNLSPCKDAVLQQTYGIFFTQHKLWSVIRRQNSLLLLPRA